MAAHTRIPRISRPKKIAALVGSGVGVAGVGLAAVLLSTSIGGFASVIDVPGTGSGGNGGGVSNSVSVDVTANAANGTNLNCSNITVSDDSKSLTFKPVLSKPAANGSNASSQPVQGGQCTIKVDVKNTGNVPIVVDSALLNLPSGWSVSATSGLDQRIEPGKSQRLTADISATQAAQPGDVSGQLVYADAPAAAPAS